MEYDQRQKHLGFEKKSNFVGNNIEKKIGGK